MAPFSSALSTYSSLYFLELGAGPAVIGLIGTVSAVTLAFSRLIGGYLADTVGRRILMSLMTVVYGLSSLIYALAPDWTWLVPAAFLSSLSLLYQPAVTAMMADSLPPERRGSGLSAAHTASDVVGLVGPPAAAALVGAVGLVPAVRMMYVGDAAAKISSGILRLFLRETLPSSRRPTVRGGLRDYLSAVRMLRGDLGRAVLITAVGGSVGAMAFPFAQIYAVKVVGISPEAWGIISTIIGLESTASTLVSGILADRVGRRVVLGAGYLSGAAGLAMLTLVPRGCFAGVLAAMAVAVAVASWPSSFAIFADLTPPEARGRMTAVRGLIMGNLRGAFSAAGGAAYQLNPALSFLAGAAGYAAVAASALLLLPGGLPRATGVEGRAIDLSQGTAHPHNGSQVLLQA